MASTQLSTLDLVYYCMLEALYLYKRQPIFIFIIFSYRIFGDLLMWEPAAPSPVELSSNARLNNPFESVHINLASHIGQLDSGVNNIGGGGGMTSTAPPMGGDKFFMCRSAFRGDGK